jgi:WD40 repeat protein/DNA-binding SARP family transcriptional activator
LALREHDDERRSMQIRVLGHLEASVDDRPVALGGAKLRAVLAMLGLEANRAVSADRLIEGLWGEEPPRSAAKMVQNYVWRLRRALADDGGAEILTRGRGYELRIDPELVDVVRLERLLAEAGRAAAAGQPPDAAREALALFRGAPLSDLADEPFAAAEIRRLDELRETAAELAIDADLAAGRHQEIVTEIEALLAKKPLRERLHAQRMLALYRCGRQAEALEAFRDARRLLVEEIGVEPGADLRGLHEAILRHDPSLELAPSELPRELDVGAAPAMVGRDGEMTWVRERWERARSGSGGLVAVIGGHGMGKTRLAGELAGEAHRSGATVLYATGWQPTQAIAQSLRHAREATRPTLLVVDDADASDAAMAAVGRVARELTGAPALVLATLRGREAMARLGSHASLTLEPLDAAAAQRIALLYAPGEVPADELLEASGGVPRRVHELASAWARRRMAAVASRAATGRRELRSVEDELVGGLAALQIAHDRADPAMDDAAPMVCPFKGLASFDVVDARYFFGRERLVAELVAKLVGAPLVGVVGPSGSGKSSLVRAGLLPALAAGVLPGSDAWPQIIIRPGDHPLRELRRAQAELVGQQHVVLVVDQFEEAFTACHDDDERHAFIDALARAGSEREGGGVVVLVVRADFYGRCATYPELARLLGANHVLVGPMRRDELRRAIELPAQRAALLVEPELVDGLIADVRDEPGGLPLLSTSLLELWQHRDGRRLRLAAYDEAGGVHGAVARLAEGAYQRLDERQQGIARAILLRLAGEGEGEAVVRSRVALDEFGEDARPVLAELTDGRLLTVSEGEVEVAHEALLREWPRLRGWLEDDAQGRRLHRHLRGAAREWQVRGRDPGELYRGARLAAALDWAAGHDPELTATERAFLDASRTASGRAQRRLQMVLAGVACLLVLAVIAALVALDERGNARDQAIAADAQRLGAQALAEDNLDRSLLLARQGVALHDSLQTRGNLLAALLKSPAAIGVLRGGGDRLTGLDLSPDQRTLAVIDDDATLSFIDTRTHRPAAPPQSATAVPGTPPPPRLSVPGALPGPAGVNVVRFSADGSRLAIGGDQLVVLDARTHRALTRLSVEGIYDLCFSPDGRTLFAAFENPSEGGTSIQRFDARSGRLLGGERTFHRSRANVTLMVTSDSRRVVTSFEGGPTVIRDARTLRPLKRLPTGAERAALSPDDRTMLIGGRDGSVRFLDLVTGDVRTASGRHDGAVARATFSADGAFAITAGEDNRLIVWDVKHAAAGETLEGHAGQITGLAISHSGHTLYTAGLDGRVIIWDLVGTRRLGRPFDVGPDDQRESPLSSFLPSYALRPDGRVLAVGHGDGTVILIDARTLQALSEFRVVPRGPVTGIAYAPRDGLLVVGGDDGFLALVDPRRGRIVKRLPGHRGVLLTPSFSADGRLMATASAQQDNTVLLWALRSGRPFGRPRLYSPSYPPWVVSLSPDGRTLAVASALGVEIIDVATLRRRTWLSGTETVGPVRFTPDGRFLVGGSYKGWARMWSTKTWQPVTRVLAGHAGEVLWHSTSPDGRTLATGSTDGTVRLIDLRAQQPLGAPLPGLPNRPVFPQFTPDGAYLFAITNAGQGYRWDVRPSSWARHACVVAGRTLTRTEWKAALPGRHYAPACTR